ncbi:hypothetical protein OIU76_020210 [Salix suchowensis]|nr:hypothetical protein OIU76_020210 [Salix suchowensis]
MFIPTGYAAGYVYGGLVGDHFNWRYAFFGEAILMLPFAILGFVIKPLQLKGFSPAESKKALTSMEIASLEVQDSDVSVVKGSMKSSKSKCAFVDFKEVSRFMKDLKVLLLEKVFVVNVIGYITYNFVLGAYSYWGPKAGYSIYNMTNADLIFGGITIFCGIVGTLAGGYALDSINSTISNAFKLLSAVTFAGAVFCFSAFCFKSMLPVNYICLHCVKPSLRPLSMAMSTVAIHLFGDVPSSPLVGVLQDQINSWRKTALILTSILFPAAAIWFIGIFMHSVDRFEEESEHPEVTTTDISDTAPLLDRKAAGTTETSG